MEVTAELQKSVFDSLTHQAFALDHLELHVPHSRLSALDRDEN